MKHMKSPFSNPFLGAFCAAVLATSGWALAQEEAAPPAGEAGGDAAAAAEAPAAPAVPVKPRPSDVLPLASKGLLLDVSNTGKHFVAVGTRGTILLSNSGLHTEWAQVQAPVRSPLTSVYFADQQNGWVVGHDAVILHTTDGGTSWKLQNFQPELEKPFLDVLFTDASTGFAVGAYGLFYKTTDGGNNWAQVDAPAIRQDELHFNSIAKLGNGNLFIAGEQGMLGISTDGGNTWEKLASPYEGSYFGVLPVGEAGALIYGLRAHIYVTQNAKTGPWKQVDTKSVVSLFGGTLLPDGRAALVGINGTILLVDPASGAVREQRVKIREKDKIGIEREKIIASSLSSAVPLDGNGLLLVGEEGVRTTALVQ